jgi:orotate phosphoribosyltransferase
MSWKKKKDSFYNFIIENDIIGFFKEPLKLKSGRLSYWYVNWRNISEDIFLLDELTDYLISFVEGLGLNPDCFYGVPEGATKLGLITQYKWAKNQPDYTKGVYSLSMGRAKPKKHGDPKDKYFLGYPKGRVVVLEDTLTTGGSLLDTIDKLISFKINIIAAIGLTDRNEIRDDGRSVKEAIEEKNIQFYAMSNAFELLPKAYEKFKPGIEIAKNIENYFKKYGKNEIKLV